MSEDCIHIEQLVVFGRVGVTENERATPQRLSLSLTIWPRARFDEVEDDIANTIDYSTVCAVVRDHVEGGSVRLIETLASDLVNLILKDFSARMVALEIQKFVVPNTSYVAVKMSRSARN